MNLACSPGTVHNSGLVSGEYSNVKLYTGTSGFGYKEWIGKFYPPDMLPKEMLHYYSERFNSVEINNTFYRMPNQALLRGWFNQVPKDFLFTLKAPRVITHVKRLRNVEQETERFIDTAAELNTKLGAILFQLPPTFPFDASALAGFLGFLPAIPAAFEFRHSSWLNPEVFSLLRERGFALCLSDQRPDSASEIVSTATWGYVRLRQPAYSESDLAVWRRRIANSGWETAYVFFKHESEGMGPKIATRFLQNP